MRRSLALTLAVLILLGSALTAVAQAQQAPGGLTTPRPPQPADTFGERVRAYILANPEVILEAAQLLQQRQQQAQADAAKGAIAARADQLFQDPGSPVAGNPSGDVTLVEFFDYNCGYCRSVAPMLSEVLRADRGLRFVFKEFPILGPTSEQAARAALAAQRQGKYAVLHDGLMYAEQPLTDDKIVAVATSKGIDSARLIKDMGDPAITAVIERNRELAAALGINGTPGFVVAGKVVPGAVDRATLEGLIGEARAMPKGETPG